VADEAPNGDEVVAAVSVLGAEDCPKLKPVEDVDPEPKDGVALAEAGVVLDAKLNDGVLEVEVALGVSAGAAGAAGLLNENPPNGLAAAGAGAGVEDEAPNVKPVEAG
jgi:hypothetical protein